MIARLQGGSRKRRGRRPGQGWGRDGGCGSRRRMRGRDGRTRTCEGRGGTGAPGATREGRAAGGAAAGWGGRAHLPHSRNSATYLSRRRAEWLHSVYRQTSTSSSVSTLRALSWRQGPSRSSCSSFLSRTLADMVPAARSPRARLSPPARQAVRARPRGPGGRDPGQRLVAAPCASSRAGLGRHLGLGPGGEASGAPGPAGPWAGLLPSAPPPSPPGAARPAPPAALGPARGRALPAALERADPSAAQARPAPPPDPAPTRAQPRGPQPTRARPGGRSQPRRGRPSPR